MDYRIAEHKVTILSKKEVKIGCTTVTQDQIYELLKAMNEYAPPKPKFAVGDYVKVVNITSHIGFNKDMLLGQYGKIVSLSIDVRNILQDEFGVELALPMKAAVGCEKVAFYPSIPANHGRWFNAEELEKVE